MRKGAEIAREVGFYAGVIRYRRTPFERSPDKQQLSGLPGGALVGHMSKECELSIRGGLWVGYDTVGNVRTQPAACTLGRVL